MKRIKWLLILVLFGAGIFFYGAYHVVSKDGSFTLVAKEKFSMQGTWIDVDDWNLIDYSRNPHISSELMKKHWSDMKRQIGNSFDDLKKIVDQRMEDLGGSEIEHEQLRKIRETAAERLKDLQGRLESREISWSAFEQEYDKIKGWTIQQIDKIEGALANQQ